MLMGIVSRKRENHFAVALSQRYNESLCAKTENVVKEFEGHNRNIERNEKSENDDINDNYFLLFKKK